MATEGPMFRGSVPFVCPVDAPPLHKLVGVTTSTEGGCFDSANGYDGEAISLGLIQITPRAGLGVFLERVFSQLSEVEMSDLRAWEARYGVDVLEEIKKGPTNLARSLYGCSGRKGSWTGACWAQAEGLFKAICPILALPEAQEIQLDYVASKILSWVMPATAKLLFQELHETGWLGALQGAVVSFSANNPAIADHWFRKHVEESGAPRAEEGYVLAAIDKMTYSPGIQIYPHRKKAILPALERLYGVKIPRDGASVLMSPVEAQRILIRLGYDLGPAGADGVFGKKSSFALREYQRMRGLDPEAGLDAKTREELAKE